MLLALAFAMLPLTGWLACVVVALVTLHRGLAQGGWVLMAALAPSIYLGLTTSPWVLWAAMGASLMLVWVAAGLLNQNHSWANVCLALIMAGIGLLFIANLSIVDVGEFWQNQLKALTPLLSQQGQQTQAALLTEISSTERWDVVAQFMLGLSIALPLFFAVVYLIIARAWQAKLFNPGGFGREFRKLSFGLKTTALLLALAGMTLFVFPQYCGLLPILVWPFLFSALALVHYLAQQAKTRQRTVYYLVIFYGAAFVLMSYSPFILIAIGAFDGFFSIRKRTMA